MFTAALKYHKQLRVSQVHTSYIFVNKATIWGSHDDDVNRRPSAQSKCT
jgi:hypothetical protein